MTEMQSVEQEVVDSAEETMLAHERKVAQHRPVNWSTPGFTASCSCGVMPATREGLVEHWRTMGLEWQERGRWLVAVAL